MNLSEYVQYDGLGLAELVRNRDVTPAELVAAAFDAMDAVDGRLNAVIGRVDPPMTGPDVDPAAPFLGMPFVLKDLWHGWGGVRCDQGSRLGEGYVYPDDGVLATRFKQAGLVTVGRANTCELGLSGMTEPILYGPTRNPWDLSRTPGGSSGGSAAAVAAGIVPLGHANDGGGSIRMPAAWCGLVGLKPSRGRNPLVAPLVGDGAYGIVAHHVVSRSVRDTAAALDATCGSTGDDYIPLAKPTQPFLDQAATEPGRLRIALCTRFRDASAPDGPCVDAALSVAKLCEELGYDVFEATPDIGYPAMVGVCYDLYTLAVVVAIEHMVHATGRAPGPDTLEAPALATLEKGRAMPATQLFSRLEELTAMSRVMGQFMADCDILLTPATSRVPVPIGSFSAANYAAGDLSYWAKEGECYTFMPLFSITGQPAMVLPLHWTDDGLPVGVQIAAAIGEEGVQFRLAGQLERARPWADRRPPVHAGAAAP